MPSGCRRLVAKEYALVVGQVAKNVAHLSSWKRLLSFAFIVLRKPPSRVLGRSAHWLVHKNLREHRGGMQLDTVIAKYTNKRRCSSRRTTLQFKACRAKYLLGEGDVTGAVCTLVSTDSFAETLQK